MITYKPKENHLTRRLGVEKKGRGKKPESKMSDIVLFIDFSKGEGYNDR